MTEASEDRETSRRRALVEASAAVGGAERRGPLPPFAMVIFGASGDLAHRKLLPALWQLALQEQLPQRCLVIGYARTAKSDDEFRAAARQACLAAGAEIDEDRWRRFAGHLTYLAGQYDQPADFARLDAQLRAFEQSASPAAESPVRVYYLSTPANVYEPIIANLGRFAGPADRIVIEKPHGRDLAEARRLNELLARHFPEPHIFRIDHYLGKETVQNILILRFSNSIFEPLWNRHHIARVDITAAETLGVEARGGFYEQSGALRDMVQMHLLQLLALVAMEQPASFAADDIRDEKAKVLRTLRPITADRVAAEAARGQYGPGRIDGRDAAGYRQEPAVAADSNTETYVSMRAWVDNWRWQGVPFHLTTGKRLAGRRTEIALHFRPVPTCLFSQRGLCARIEPNVLVMRIQPQEGVHLDLSSKVPGAGLNVGGVRMGFEYASLFGRQPPEAYETLLMDAVLGDAALFPRRDQVELSWQFVQPVLDAWRQTPATDFPNYPAGTSGPELSREFLAGG